MRFQATCISHRVPETRTRTAIIGSSPMCLIAAITLAKRGDSVVLFEENSRLGGAWRTEFLENCKLEVEIACHLIENHGNSYALLSEASGVKFQKLDPQPVKFYKEASERGYFSRATVWKEAKHFTLLTFGVFVSFMFDFGIAKIRRLRNLSVGCRFYMIRRYKFFLRFRFPKMFTDPYVEHPVGGSVAFINGLINRAKEMGVEIIQARVVGLDPIAPDVNHGTLRLVTQSGDVYEVDKAILSGSTTLAGAGDKVSNTADQRRVFSHAVYFLPSCWISRELPYMHFVDDLNVHRVTILDSESVLKRGAERDGKYLLAQFRQPNISSENRRRIFCQLMADHGILAPDFKIEECEECGYFEESFYGAPEEASMFQETSNISSPITVLDTIGDLGRLVVLFAKSKL